MNRLLFSLIYCATLISSSLVAESAEAVVHQAPVVVPAHKVRSITRFPLKTYRLFKVGAKGLAETIPFQIDELNYYSDYIMPEGPLNNIKTSNGLFDNRDELSFMGEDVGPDQEPKGWTTTKPDIIYKLKIKNGKQVGAVFVGIYFYNPPKLNDKSYVKFNLANGEIKTSRFLYKFDRSNYLVVRGVDVNKPNKVLEEILLSSTFYLKADLKYFLTFTFGHSDIESKLEAYKVGPIRTLVRVAFTYSALRLKFDLGMYTEVSFFANAVHLPAIMYNPLDGSKSLNDGSAFYYGFNFAQNPKTMDLKTNLPSYKSRGLSALFNTKPKVKEKYWVETTSDDYMIYLEIEPSKQMIKTGNTPSLYSESIDGKALKKRPNNKVRPLGKSPVNLGVNIDLNKFSEGEHKVAFRLFFENKVSKDRLEEFKRLGEWNYEVHRL